MKTKNNIFFSRAYVSYFKSLARLPPVSGSRWSFEKKKSPRFNSMNDPSNALGVLFASHADRDGRVRTDSAFRGFLSSLLEHGVVDPDGMRDADALREVWARSRGADGISYEEMIAELSALHASPEEQLVGEMLKREETHVEGLVNMCSSWMPVRGKMEILPESDLQLRRMLAVVDQLGAQHEKAICALMLEASQTCVPVHKSAKRDREMVAGTIPAIDFQMRNLETVERKARQARVRALAFVGTDGRRVANPKPLPDAFGHALARAYPQGGVKCYLARSGSGKMVEVVRIPRRDVSADQSNACFNSHAAHRQLILSPYFPDWMGLGLKNANKSDDHIDLCYAHHRTSSLWLTCLQAWTHARNEASVPLACAPRSHGSHRRIRAINASRVWAPSWKTFASRPTARAFT